LCQAAFQAVETAPTQVVNACADLKDSVMPCHRSPWVLWVMGFAQSVGQQRGLSVVRKGDECSGTALHFLAAEGHAQAVEMGSPINDRSGNMYLQDSNTSLSKLSKSYSFRVEGSILISDQ